ncbi:MAG: metallophosphoesterase [Myxococcota bacterium]
MRRRIVIGAYLFALLGCNEASPLSSSDGGAVEDARADASADAAPDATSSASDADVPDSGLSDAGLADTGAADGGTPGPCPPCVIDQDCLNGALCMQFSGDTYCAPSCVNNACDPDRICQTLSSAEGQQASVCVPLNDLCGATPEVDAGLSPDGSSNADGGLDHCGDLIGPNVMGHCFCSASFCQDNGCFGGWWCNTQTNRCQRPPNPSSCAPDAGTGPLPDAGFFDGDGGIGPNGGSVSELRFAIVGDTRPPIPDDTRGYPTAVITQIWQDVQAEAPLFAISTGDYMFAGTRGNQGAAQLDLYLGARAAYRGLLFPALGNHECTGGTASNCGPGSANGVTRNYQAFLDKMLAPIGKTLPYFVIHVNAADQSWTAKLVFIAANAWNSDQGAWLETAMAEPTTYTFVVRHEPHSATTAPGVPPSDAVIARHPYTMLLVGHTHTLYGSIPDKEYITGNGGAPLSGSVNYGYVIVARQPDGTIRFDAHDYSTRAVFRSFHVNPDGTAAP